MFLMNTVLFFSLSKFEVYSIFCLIVIMSSILIHFIIVVKGL